MKDRGVNVYGRIYLRLVKECKHCSEGTSCLIDGLTQKKYAEIPPFQTTRKGMG